jgi:hypothetical protein
MVSSSTDLSYDRSHRFAAPGNTGRKGRLFAFIARNCDLDDAWAWIDDPRYPLKYGLAAYRAGINVIIYAITH